MQRQSCIVHDEDYCKCNTHSTGGEKAENKRRERRGMGGRTGDDRRGEERRCDGRGEYKLEV